MKTPHPHGHMPLLGLLALIAVIALPSSVSAQRGRPTAGSGRPSGAPAARAVRRPPAYPPGRPVAGPGPGRSYRPYYGARPYYSYPGYAYWPGSSLSIGFAFGYPVGYGGFGWYGYGHPTYGYGYPAYGHGYGYGGYASYPGYAAAVPYRPYGGVRIQVPQRHAEVWVGGYFVGHVDDFDGTYQRLNLEPGAHRIEIRSPGFETVEVDVKIDPGRIIHYRSDMRPVP